MSQLLPDDLSLARSIIAQGPYRFESMTHLFLAGQQVSSDRAVWDVERAKLSKVLDAVAELGGKSVYMMTGGHGDLVWEEAAGLLGEILCEGLWCVEAGADRRAALRQRIQFLQRKA